MTRLLFGVAVHLALVRFAAGAVATSRRYMVRGAQHLAVEERVAAEEALWQAFVESEMCRADDARSADLLQPVQQLVSFFRSFFRVGPSDEPYQESNELRAFMNTPTPYEEESGHLEKNFRPDHSMTFTPAERQARLVALLRAWHSLCHAQDLQYWLDSGTLMGVHRTGGKALIPWDGDADVVMPDAHAKKLIETAHSVGDGQVAGPSLGLPPHMLLATKQGAEDGDFHSADPLDTVRNIPIKLIDTQSGYYIDVFGAFDVNSRVHVPDNYAPQQCGEVKCFDYLRSDVYPLARCHLEGAGDLACPANTFNYLMTEFGSTSPDRELVDGEFRIKRGQ